MFIPFIFYGTIKKILLLSDQWVMKFENDYELYYKNSSADILDNISDVEAAFEALHQQVETEYQLHYPLI